MSEWIKTEDELPEFDIPVFVKMYNQDEAEIFLAIRFFVEYEGWYWLLHEGGDLFHLENYSDGWDGHDFTLWKYLEV